MIDRKLGSKTCCWQLCELRSSQETITLQKKKAVTVIEPDKESEMSGVGLNDLNEQLKSLGQYLKSATFTAKTKFSRSS